MSNVPSELPGDLGPKDPRRLEHPVGNEPGAGGHEVKGTGESSTNNNTDQAPPAGGEHQKAHTDHSTHGEGVDPRAEEMGIASGKRDEATGEEQARMLHNSRSGQQGQDYRGVGQEGYDSSRTGSQYGVGQEGYDSSRTGSQFGAGQPGYDSARSGSQYGVGSETGYNRPSEVSRTDLEGASGSHVHGHHSSLGAGAGQTFSSGAQSGTEPLSGQLGSGTAGEPYDAGNYAGKLHSSSSALAAPNTNIGQDGTAPQQYGHGHGPHNTRIAELLDPVTSKETGVPGYGLNQNNNQL